jgi:hypothetical protein
VESHRRDAAISAGCLILSASAQWARKMELLSGFAFTVSALCCAFCHLLFGFQEKCLNMICLLLQTNACINDQAKLCIWLVFAFARTKQRLHQ